MPEQRKPVIGVLAQWKGAPENNSFTRQTYVEAARVGGGLAIVIPVCETDAEMLEACALCDGVMLTGGPDIDASYYGQANGPLTQPCPERDAPEVALARSLVRSGKPLFAICRGIQVLNVALGGTLVQDIPSEYGVASGLHRHSEDMHLAAHSVRIVADTPLALVAGGLSANVNSSHHQAIARLADGLQAMAWSDEGFPEAVWMPGHPFCWGVQWHPERMLATQPLSRAMMRVFCEAALRFALGR